MSGSPVSAYQLLSLEPPDNEQRNAPPVPGALPDALSSNAGGKWVHMSCMDPEGEEEESWGIPAFLSFPYIFAIFYYLAE